MTTEEAVDIRFSRPKNITYLAVMYYFILAAEVTMLILIERTQGQIELLEGKNVILLSITDQYMDTVLSVSGCV
jgi:hypothetical protein